MYIAYDLPCIGVRATLSTVFNKKPFGISIRYFWTLHEILVPAYFNHIWKLIQKDCSQSLKP